MTIISTADSSKRAWTEQAVRGLGLTTDVVTAASILGIGRTKAYQLVQAGEFPVKVLRVGRRYLVPVPAILESLGCG
ncbi:helix-turn-helix domain-containing protein [Solwaraspora sp. WMMD1047]|uniref:helix-turn-helix domain-containing protein n=1 Tax=Solwaraspora sp. WMMD1047 TaxID=3016102 RepID=UPI00241624BD|nr:helix-turn-helix domain-containing protein [Solwaraspora sp. WMMD1047]MDG4833040.1 helix-turn-helix domain-containing protein [Solwaraspora sp. WMMD1047]